MFDEISERRKMEDQYHQAQKMESVGRLAGGVAHDFNNALSVITGFTEMAIDSTDPSEPLHEDLNEILMAAKRAADITRQLLAFARKQTIAPKVLDLNDNVENTLKMLRRLIGEDLDLAWMPGANLWSVKMDPTQIDQILANLCVNARDAIDGVGIAKQNNGFVNAYSEPDKGTSITIYLPRHEEKAVEIPEKSIEESPQGQGETILVVEDDPSILNIMEKILQRLGYTVLTSNAPEKTMDMVKDYTGRVHLLITDVIIPRMNGRDLAEQLQFFSPDLNCIFMSGYTADAIARQGVLDKGVNFIQKPFSRRDLAKIVRKVLDENQS